MSSDAGTAFTVIGVAVILVAAAIANKKAPKNCDICGVRIVNKYHIWTSVEGTEQKVCPQCNANIKRRKSAAAMKKKFG